jgi:hypothetical protein
VGGILAAQTCTTAGSSAITSGNANYVRVNVSTWSVNPVTIVYKGWAYNPIPGTGTVTGVTAGTGITVSGSPPLPTVAVTNPLPTGVAAGSACVSNGVGLPCAYQSKPAIDWLDQNVTTTGDQSTNITAAWNAVGSKNAGLIRSNPSGNYQFGTSVAPNSFGAYGMEGLGGAGQLGSGANFLWTGGAAYAFNLDRQRDSIVGRMNLNLNAISGAGGVTVTQLTGTSGQISSHNLYHDWQISGLNGSGAIGFNIVAASGDTQANNEAHTFWRMGIGANTTYNSGSTCFNLGTSANARSIAFYESELLGCGTGFSLAGGSWHVLGGLTEQHIVALTVGASFGGTYAFVHDESSKQGVTASGSSSYATVLFNNSYEMDSPDLTKYYWDFSGGLSDVLSLGNIMKSNSSVTKAVKPQSSGQWVSILDEMPNATISALPVLPQFQRAITIGTITPFTGGNFSGSATYGGITAFTIQKNSQAGDNDALTGPVNALYLGSTQVYSQGTSQWYSSPGFALAANYNDGAAAIHQVPFRYKVLLSDATGTSAATWKFMPMVDPVTSTTYGGVANFDYQTNGNNFSINHAKVTDLSSTGQITSTLATGTAPLSITSTTPVANLAVAIKGAVFQITASSITGIVGADFSSSMKAAESLTVQNIIGSAAALATCTTNPTITFLDCGASTTCASPTTIGTVTVTAANTITAGTVSNPVIASGDFIVGEVTAGSCATLSNLSASMAY